MKKYVISMIGIAAISSLVSFAQISVGSAVNLTAASDTKTTNASSSGMMTTSVNVNLNSSSSMDANSAAFSEYSEMVLSETVVGITAVNDSDSEVIVDFAENVKLFGFIPVTMTSSVSVDNESNVNVDRPFWAFLATGYSDSATIESSVTSKVKMPAATTMLSAGMKMEILNSIKASLDANLTSEVK